MLLVLLLVLAVTGPAYSQAPGTEIRKIAVLDRAGTGQQDILAVGRDRNSTYPSDTKLVYLKNDGKSLSEPVDFEQQIPQPFNISTGKLNNDGLDDIIAIGYGSGGENGGLFYSLNQGGSFTPFEKLPAHLQNTEIWASALQDVDGDGKVDIVGIFNQNTDFITQSQYVWAKNLTPKGADPGKISFDYWKPLSMPVPAWAASIADFEIAFDMFDGKLGAVRLGQDTKTPAPYVRRINSSLMTGNDFDEGQPSGVITPRAAMMLGQMEDIDIGRQGTYLLLRKDLNTDGTSASDHIYLIRKVPIFRTELDTPAFGKTVYDAPKIYTD